MAIKRINDPIGRHGLVATIRVYGTLPSLGFTFDQPHQSLYKYDHAVWKSNEELSKKYAKRQVKSALSSQHASNVEPIHETCIWKVSYSLLH